METAARGYSLDFIHSMITQESGRTSGWINDLELRSIFQPAFSLHHRCAIGFEANLRSRDDKGRSVSPQALFGPVQNFAQTSMLDMLCIALHVGNFASARPDAGMLLINLHPDVLLDSDNSARFLSDLFRHHRFDPHRVMIDVPGSVLNREGIGEAVAAYRSLGCLIAVDDFGDGNTNLDTIWHINPAVVKIDRVLTERAVDDRRMAQTLQRAVSLLHEMGTLVLMEGLEQEADVLVALESDADMGSGFHLGPMHESIDGFTESTDMLDGLWRKCFERPAPSSPAEALARSTLEDAALHSSNIRKFRHASPEEIARYRERRRPFLNAIQDAAGQLRTGAPLEKASMDFLALPGAIRCYLLDGLGIQTAPAVTSPTAPAIQSMDFLSLCRTNLANWSQRDFFRRAVKEPGVTQVTRQYCSMLGYRHCVTFSIAVNVAGKPVVLCGDVDWTEHAPQ